MMIKKLTANILSELKDEGYTALIAAGQLGRDDVVYTLSKEPMEQILESAKHTPSGDGNIIILSDENIKNFPEVFFEGKEVELS